MSDKYKMYEQDKSYFLTMTVVGCDELIFYVLLIRQVMSRYYARIVRSARAGVAEDN